MDYRYRWDPCIAHRDDELEQFLVGHLGRRGCTAFLVAGAGFDPRTCVVAERLSANTNNVRALLIRERRPNPRQDLTDWADERTRTLLDKIPDADVESVEIFGADNGVVGGRNVIDLLLRQDLSGVTDILIDASALSTGILFPIIRYFVEETTRRKGCRNIHVFVVHDPVLDNSIVSTAGDQVGHIHGFMGRSTLSEFDDAARLWLPQLAPRMGVALERIYNFVAPHDTCPILPFPASDPRLGDKLAEEYLAELEVAWKVDTRNIVYADEGDPLDLYRTILRLDESRKPVFVETGGSILVLSPLGSKVMALGVLMAALERDLPVAYLEPMSYELTGHEIDGKTDPSIVHLWLEGDVYPIDRPKLPWEIGGRW